MCESIHEHEGRLKELTKPAQWPRITIVTPTYNRATYLEETILSVISQDYPNLEYLIVDGGSTDQNVLTIIRKYEHRLTWWTSEKDRGHAEAIRKGFARSTGDVMTWLCSDDAYLPGTLRAVGKFFAVHPEAEVVYGNSRIIDAGGRKVRDVHAVPYARLALIHHLGLLQPSTFWKRKLYWSVGGQLGGPNLEYNIYEPHIELFCRFANAGANFRFLRQVLTCVRHHDDRVPVTPALGKLVEKAWREGFPFCTRAGVFEVIKGIMRLRQLYYYLIQGDFEELADYLKSRWCLRPARF